MRRLYIRDSGRIVGLTEEGYATDVGGPCDPTSGECDAHPANWPLLYSGTNGRHGSKQCL